MKTGYRRERSEPGAAGKRPGRFILAATLGLGLHTLLARGAESTSGTPTPAATAATAASEAPLPGERKGVLAGSPEAIGMDPHALGEAMAGALVKTEALADGDILSEEISSGYRIGLILGPARPVRSRTAAGAFLPAHAPEGPITFVGVVLREERTKRFLPAASVKAVLEYESGGEVELEELVGPYPVYGKNLKLPVSGVRGITIKVGPPAYNRHAEMLAAFTGEGKVRFELKDHPGNVPNYSVAAAKKPAPVAEDWKIGDDLRQAVGEARAWDSDGDYAVGFVVEGPEPIWLWQGDKKPPQHCPVGPADTNHIEAVVVHMPTGLNVTSATAMVRFYRVHRGSAPEQHQFLLKALLADYYHYGLTTAIPPGTWAVQVAVVPSRLEAWGNALHPPAPEDRLLTTFQYHQDAPGAPGAGEAEGFAGRLDAAAAQYATGDRPAATKSVVDAFFAFEGSTFDRTLSAADPGAYKSLEMNWIALRSKMEAGEDPAAVTTAASGVSATLRQLGAAPAIATPGTAEPGSTAGASAFVQSFFVLLREGFEAILVLSLLVGVLRKTGKTEALRLVWGGAGAGVAASLVLAAIGAAVFRGMGAAREGFEGFTLLASVVVLFFTSFWLISRVEGRRWAAFVKNQIEGAIGSGRRMAIGLLAFLVVFREGAETVLFYAGLFASAHGAAMQILAGIGVAAVALVVVFVITVNGGAKLPVRQFFGITGALLYLLAFKFAGDGFAELQASGLVHSSPLGWVPNSDGLKSWLGIYPTLQTSLAQGVLLLAVIAGLAWTMVSRPQDGAARGGAVAR